MASCKWQRSTSFTLQCAISSVAIELTLDILQGACNNSCKHYSSTETTYPHTSQAKHRATSSTTVQTYTWWERGIKIKRGKTKEIIWESTASNPTHRWSCHTKHTAIIEDSTFFSYSQQQLSPYSESALPIVTTCRPRLPPYTPLWWYSYWGW